MQCVREWSEPGAFEGEIVMLKVWGRRLCFGGALGVCFGGLNRGSNKPLFDPLDPRLWA
jgi:hypothetical protein